MNYKLSKHALDVTSNRMIDIKWIDAVLKSPSLIVKVSIVEAHYFLTILENESRCLKVVINPTTGVVITAYFDRNMRKKGCR
ncbi:DUF4258 domain-containing protein [Sulfurimonas sp. SAG-AH-194-L11]|nr:DUF4258 domain-containing protein [Sulfurimonas sp. SAG-AH-194-L11]MDF1877322.1 DUF4258 domain-containing protein [Sulfurimonas sp. SAG-AH-194-L11]